MKHTLIINIITDRIIFFTSDVNYRPIPTQYSWVAEYERDLPIGMTIQNCFSYKLINGVIQFADNENTNVKLFAQNKVSLKRDLNNKIALKKQSLYKLEPFIIAECIAVLAGNNSNHIEALAKTAKKPTFDLANELIVLNDQMQRDTEKLELLKLELLYSIDLSGSDKELEIVRRKVYAI